jgi:acetylornithine deacetylase/succinyl-diaminopimelate desuccinylase-like protein
VPNRWGGFEPTTAPYGTNASDYTTAMMRACVIMGPGSIDQAHQADEWIDIAELHKMRSILRQWWLAPFGQYE